MAEKVFEEFEHFTPFRCLRIMNNASQNEHLINSIRLFSKLYPEEYLAKKVPLPLTEKDLNKEKGKQLSMQNILFLENAEELFETALRTRRMKATMYYYSFHSLFAFLVYTLLKYDGPAHGHGMKVSPMEENNIGVEFYPRIKQGFLQRIIDLFTILGYPIALADKIPIITKSGLEFRDNNISKIIIGKKVSYDEIYNFDIDLFIRNCRDLNEIHEHQEPYPQDIESYLINSNILNHIFFFIASNFERYRPQYWSSILEGNNEFSSKVVERTKKAYRFYPSIMKNISVLLVRNHLC